MQTGFWSADLRERHHLEDVSADKRIILKWLSKKWDGDEWTGLIRLRIGTGGWRLKLRVTENARYFCVSLKDFAPWSYHYCYYYFT